MSEGLHVLVTGVGDRLGRLVATRMATHPDVEVVTGVAGVGTPVIAGVRMVALSAEYDGIADLVRERAIDTIIHADRPWARPRAEREAAARHVIATMRLAAAAAHRSTSVRRIVMASSTRVYAASSRAARLHPESEHVQPRHGSLAALLVEAEGYLRTLATTNPNMSASLLRLADLTGRGIREAVAALLAGRVVPAVWGFDPPVQLLHVDDAVAAFEHAATHDLAGIYNVGAPDLVRWRRAARLVGKPLIELPAAPTGPLSVTLRWLYRLDAVDDIVDVLRFGRGAATDAFARSGFQPARTTAQCVREAAHPR